MITVKECDTAHRRGRGHFSGKDGRGRCCEGVKSDEIPTRYRYAE